MTKIIATVCRELVISLLPRRLETGLQLLTLGCCFQTCLRCGGDRGTDNDLFI